MPLLWLICGDIIYNMGQETMRKLLTIIGLIVGLFLAGCGNEAPKKTKDDAPAGHPDELKDTTRLDPAPRQHESDGKGPE